MLRVEGHMTLSWARRAALLVLFGCSARQPSAAIPPPRPDSVSSPARRPAEPSVEVGEAVVTPRLCPLAEVEPPVRPDFSAVQQEIRDLLRREGIPSLTVAVARSGELLWSEGFGWADRRRRVRATPDTMYSLASISKPMTATAIMVLRERGLLRLEDPIRDHLPGEGIRAGVGDPREATIERVANHTAGLPLHMHFFHDADPPPAETTRARHALLVTAPGERFRYSNLGYGLLEHVIEQVSGTNYATFMQEEVFAPLGLRHTSVGRPPRSAHRRVAVRYDGRGEPIGDYEFDHAGGSAVYSSANDLLVFGMAHLGFRFPDREPLLPRDAFARMLEVQPPSRRYGLGWNVERIDGEPAIWHVGDMPGVTTVLLMFPARAVVVTVLVNELIEDGMHTQLAGWIAHLAGVPVRSDMLCSLPPTHPIFAHWGGDLDLEGRKIPLQIDIDHDGRVRVSAGGITFDLFGVQLENGDLRGYAMADLGVAEAEGRPREVRFDLQLRDDRLTGSVTTIVPWVAALTGFADLRPSVTGR